MIGDVKTVNFQPSTSLFNSTLTYTNQISFIFAFYLPTDIVSGFNNFLSTRRTTQPDFIAINTGPGNGSTSAGTNLQLFNNNSVTASTVIPSKLQWYILAGVYDVPNSKTTLYLNGELITEGPPCSSLFTNDSLRLNGYGTRTLSGGSFAWNLCHLDVWRDKALTQDEVITRTQELSTLYAI